jgi:hypothetical protein
MARLGRQAAAARGRTLKKETPERKLPSAPWGLWPGGVEPAARPWTQLPGGRIVQLAAADVDSLFQLPAIGNKRPQLGGHCDAGVPANGTGIERGSRPAEGINSGRKNWLRPGAEDPGKLSDIPGSRPSLGWRGCCSADGSTTQPVDGCSGRRGFAISAPHVPSSPISGARC